MKKKDEVGVTETSDIVDTTDSVEVKWVYLHGSISWPGVIVGERTLSAVKIKGLKMHLLTTLPILYIEAKGRKGFVPISNIESGEFA